MDGTDGIVSAFFLLRGAIVATSRPRLLYGVNPFPKA